MLRAQEEMRRDIARQMHDGPAQSLTNIALQAEIVQRLLDRDPQMARAEVEALRRMVQRALDATKSFIFDVRPMVLDDLGLLPTLRRAATDRGKRAGVPIEFESRGADRRLPPDLESGFFRIIDDALVGFLSLHPSQLDLHLEWSERDVRATVRSGGADERASLTRANAEARGPEPVAEPDMPPALAQMIHEQRADDLQARTDAHALPPERWQEIQARAETIGVSVELVDAGQTMEATAHTS
ncbi:MAG TPA: histidine kinase [Candidatus Limnocylindrales bacterium]|nr:histidine kinase [Candidatus Limnocylindrales bacterium]